MNAFAIRRAAPSDIPALLLCLREAFAPYRAAYTADAYRDTVLTMETAAARLREMSVLVATDPALRIIGSIAFAPVTHEEGHLRGMAVIPAWQGRGIAGALLATAEHELRSRGCSRVTLDTTRPLEPAIRFYESRGYRTRGTVRDFFGMELIAYEKALTPLQPVTPRAGRSGRRQPR